MLRKQPRQGRSRNTFSCIVEAASSLIAESDLRNINTKLIAHKAGVSIPDFLSTHPNPVDRYDKVHAHSDKAQMNLDKFLAQFW